MQRATCSIFPLPQQLLPGEVFPEGLLDHLVFVMKFSVLQMSLQLTLACRSNFLSLTSSSKNSWGRGKSGIYQCLLEVRNPPGYTRGPVSTSVYNRYRINQCMKGPESTSVYEVRKGLQRQQLIGSAVAGFNHARTITKASAMGLDTRQDAYNKGMCSPGSLVNIPVR